MRQRWVVGGIVVLAFGLRARTALAAFETWDERTWMVRSTWFWDSVAGGDLGSASAAPEGGPATMPGVMTMWIGSAARGVWNLGTHLGLWDRTEPESQGGLSGFTYTRAGLDLAQVGVALVTALLIGVIVVLVSRWAGRGAAAIAGVLLATEPFVVAHGAIFHTDELSALFGVAAALAVVLALGLPEPTDWAGRRGVAIAAGALFGGAFLTKIAALTLLPGLAALGVWAVWRVRRDRAALRALARLSGWGLGAAAATVVLAYPALWADPVTEVRSLVRSARLGEEGHQQFFFGQATQTPGIRFYAVALPFRVTPWLLAAAAVAAIAVWRRGTRGWGTVLAVLAVSPFVILSLASKQVDRYGLVLIVVACVLVGVVVGPAVTSLGNRSVRPIAALATVAVVVFAWAVTPWGLAYFNPALGGSDRAEETLLVGWGEGLEDAGRLIADIEDGRCADVTYLGGLWTSAHFRCGRPPPPGEPAKYVVAYVMMDQIWPETMAERIAGRELLAERTIRGITYLRIYGPRSPSWSDGS